MVKTNSLAAATPGKILQPNTPGHGADKKLSTKA